MRLAALLGVVLVFASCGDDDSGGGSEPPLPKKPQILPNPDTGFLMFALTEANDPQGTDFPLVLGNGGQGDLEITSATIQDPGSGGASAFSLDPLSSTTVKSRQAVSLPVHFNPGARGVYIATLVVESNAENTPTLEVQLIGPAATTLVQANPKPDIESFEAVAEATLFEGASEGIAFVRYVNLGPGLLHVVDYAITDDTDNAFSLQSGVAAPSAECASACPVTAIPAGCNPILLGPGDFVILPVDYTPPATGTHTATFVITSDDEDMCELEVGLTGTY
jgi:hypothetical protein